MPAGTDEVERALLDIWNKVLDGRCVSVDRSFIECGGDSIAGVRVVTRIGKELGHQVPLAVLLDSLTIRELAAEINASRRAPSR